MYNIPTNISTISNAQTWADLFFKNYLDNHTDRHVWERPRLNIQIDNWMHVVLNNTEVMKGGSFDLSYDLIVLDESEAPLGHGDEGARNKNGIEI